MANHEPITPEIRAVIGQVSGPFALELTRTSCRAFARAVGYTDPIFYDADAAQAAGHRDIPAPPGYLGTWPWSPSNSENRQFVEEIPTTLGRRLNGGTELEYYSTPCAGDTLTVEGIIVEVSAKETSMGITLIVTREVEFRDRDGSLVARLRGTSMRY